MLVSTGWAIPRASNREASKSAGLHVFFIPNRSREVRKAAHIGIDEIHLLKHTTMWKKLFILVMVLITSLCAWSADGDTFQAETPGGVMMKFMVISEAEKTCAVASDAIDDYTTKGVVTVPEEVKGYKVVEIQPNSFDYSYYITSVSLPNTLTAIGSYAFSGCTSLTAITLPGSLTAIGDRAFSDCSRLSTLNLPSTTTEIGEYAFSGCYNIQNFIVPEQVTVLNKGVFEGCLTLFNIVLPDGLKIIGDEAFSDCQYLNAPELPEGLDSIGKATFYRCYCFTEITIPSTVTRMGGGILNDCYR